MPYNCIGIDMTLFCRDHVLIRPHFFLLIRRYVEYEDMVCLGTMNRTECDRVPVVNPIGVATCRYCPDENTLSPCSPGAEGCMGLSDYEGCTSIIAIYMFILPQELVVIIWTSHWLYVLSSYIVTCA